LIKIFKIWITSFLVLLASSVNSQNLNKAEKKIHDGEFEKADEIISKYKRKNPNSCCGYYYKALLAFEKSLINLGYSNPNVYLTSYLLLDSAKSLRYNQESLTEIEDIKFTSEKNENKDPLFYFNAYDNSFTNLKIKVDEKLFISLKNLNNEDSLNYYFNSLNEFVYLKELQILRDEIAYNNALNINTENSFDNFQKKYPNTKLYSVAQEKKIKACYNDVIKILSIESLNSFIQKYNENKSLTDICKFKKDSLLFQYAYNEMTESAFEKYINFNKESVYNNIANYYIDSLKYIKQIKNNDPDKLERYIQSSTKTRFYNELICELISLKYLEAANENTITSFSKFYTRYLIEKNEERILLTLKNKRSNELRQINLSELSSFNENEWKIIKTSLLKNECSKDFYFVRDSIYNKLNNLRKIALKNTIQNNILDQIIFKSNSGKILKQQIYVNDPINGGMYLNINLNVSPIELLLKNISSIQNFDKLCFFAFQDYNNDLSFTSYLPGIFQDNYISEIHNIISSRLNSFEIVRVNNVTKTSLDYFPEYFYKFENIENIKPDNLNNCEIHKIDFTLKNGQNLSIIFSKSNFIFCFQDLSISIDMQSPVAYNKRKIDRNKHISKNNRRVELKRNQLYQDYRGNTDVKDDEIYEETVVKSQNYYIDDNKSSFVTNSEKTIYNHNSDVFTVAEEMPEFPGGMGELMKFLQNNINYPESERLAGIQGKVYVKFIIQPDGSLTNLEILRGVAGGEGLSNEAIRVVMSMPQWKPGKQSGRNVAVYFNLPINFKLN